MNRVFFSYATENRSAIERYIPAFAAAGLEALVDYGQIGVAESIPAGINRMISTSVGAVLFYSAEYARKPWTTEEQNALIFRSIDRGEYKVVVVRLDLTEVPPLLQHRVWLRTPDARSLALVFAPDVRAPLNGAAVGKPIENWLQTFTFDELERVATGILTAISERPAAPAIEARTKTAGAVTVHLTQPPVSRLTDQLTFVLRMITRVSYIRNHLRQRISGAGLGVFEPAFMLAEQDNVQKIEEFRKELRETLDAMVDRVTMN